MKKLLSMILALCLLISAISAFTIGTGAYTSGDLNNDGKINAIDASMMCAVIVGGESTSLALKMADIDGDKKVNSTDDNLMKLYFVGKYELGGTQYKIGTIVICGKDITEFVIECPGDADECMKYAAETLQSHIGDACGLYPEIVNDAEGMYAIRLIKDTTAAGEEAGILEEEAYHIYSYEKGIIIEGGIYSGCMHGVYDFMYNYLGYRYYYKNGIPGNNYEDGATRFVYSTDKINIDNVDDTHYPSIDVRRVLRVSGYSSPALAVNTPVGDESIKKFGFYGQNVPTCHGLLNLFSYNELAEYGAKNGRQPCFSNSSFINETTNRVLSVLDAKKNAGQIPGKDFCGIDVSQIDVMDFCICRLCNKTRLEDGSQSGNVVKFGNAISRAIQEREEYKDKIYVNVFAYFGTEKAPLVTRPDKMTQISFCFYQAEYGRREPCNGHTLNDETCEFNSYYIKEFEKWCEMTEYISVWYYPLIGRFLANTSIYIFNMYDDVRYFVEKGVRYLYLCSELSNDNFDALGNYILQRLTWNCEMTREEYYDMIKETLDLMYGSAGKYIWQYLCIMEEVADAAPGKNGKGCYFTYVSSPMATLGLSKLKEKSEELLSIRNSAVAVAEEDHLYYVTQLTMPIIYLYCAVNHTSMWLNGTTEQRAKYKELIDYYVANAKKYMSPIAADLESQSRLYVDSEMEIDYDKNPFVWMTDLILSAPGNEGYSVETFINFMGWNTNFDY